MITEKIHISWTDLKAKANALDGILFYHKRAGLYYIYLEEYIFHFFTEIEVLSPATNPSDQKDFEDNFKDQAEINGKIYRKSVVYENIVNRVSHDFCDKRTWHQGSTTKTAQAMTNSGDNKTYTFGDSNVIDLFYISDRALLGATYEWTVYKDAVKVTSGLTLDHANNQITFATDQGAAAITADYHVAAGSIYDLTPDAGKFFTLKYVELQLSKGAILNDDIAFDAIINNATTGNTDYVAGSTPYYSAQDIINKSNHGTSIPPFGGLTKDIIVMPWNFLNELKILPVGTVCDAANLNQFNKLRVKLASDTIPTGGCEIATATFYCDEGKL